MKNALKYLIKSSLKKVDICITRYSTLQKSMENEAARYDEAVELLLILSNGHSSQLLNCLRKSKSQIRQDLFVLSQLNFKKNGYFVEFGATNGIDLSNTYLMEKEFGWTGILAEPATFWHTELKNNRNANIETRCVWSNSNSILKFNEVASAELSTIDLYSNTDFHCEARNNCKSYNVNTISLNDLLIKYDAPKEIDYLSIDTEGSEFEILNNFDFSKHHISVITCEHNFTQMRNKVFELLSSNGYIRKYKELSRFDDWYVKSN